MIRYSIVAINLLVLLSVILFIVQKPHDTTGLNQASASEMQHSVVNPLDQVSSADIARTVAQITNLPEATSVKNQAETTNAQLTSAPAFNAVAAKPQVVVTSFKSREDIQTYVTKTGDSVSSVAAKFNITSSSLQWSNNISGDNVSAGVKLTIPPINGIVYTVKAGDTASTLAQKYNSNITQLIAYNDAEISGLNTGEQIIIPNGQIPQAPAYNFFAATYGGNGYDYGFCTWYVATQIPVPSNWGNASSWAYYGALSGWIVSTVPVVGAIAQTAFAAGGEGHVAIVNAVSADGTQIQFRDMNGVAGYARVGYSGWVPVSSYQHYIYR
jgi:surface antigen